MVPNPHFATKADCSIVILIWNEREGGGLLSDKLGRWNGLQLAVLSVTKPGQTSNVPAQRTTTCFEAQDTPQYQLAPSHAFSFIPVNVRGCIDYGCDLQLDGKLLEMYQAA